MKTGNLPFYGVIVCTLGGLLIGVLRKKFGDYPQEMGEVFGILKQTGTYDYKKLPVMIVLAMLPLALGASIGPEAGMVGIIVGLCCWAGDNLKFAKQSTVNYSKIGAAVSLSVMFHSPLFGFFHQEENEGDDGFIASLTKSDKVVTYAVAIGAGLGLFSLLSNFVCKVSEGLPSFESAALPQGYDYLAFILYLVCGILLGLFFEKSEHLLKKIHVKCPPVVGEVIVGLILGVVITFVPAVQFSGEAQMGVLIADYAQYAPLALIGVALLKVVMTNLCIQFGWKGGHFFPLIFAAVCLGYGLSLLIFPGAAEHAVFAAAVVTSAALGFSVQKPLAVTVLLFLCFPVRMAVWLFISAALAGFIVKAFRKQV